MKRGAFDYFVKPVDLERLSQILDRALDAARLMNVPAVLPVDGQRATASSATSTVMQEMCKRSTIRPGRPAGHQYSDSGRERDAGKELAGAGRIYQHSPPGRLNRSWPSTAPPFPRPCWRASCSATKAGRSTGADPPAASGTFEQCNGGTLFLDE